MTGVKIGLGDAERGDVFLAERKVVHAALKALWLLTRNREMPINDPRYSELFLDFCRVIDENDYLGDRVKEIYKNAVRFGCSKASRDTFYRPIVDQLMIGIERRRSWSR